MALLKLMISCAAILSFVSAQSSNTQLQIESVQAQFQNAQLVPIPVPVFNPSAVLTANFGGAGTITPGQLLVQNIVQAAPQLTVTPANSSVVLTGNYLLAMVDPGAVGTNSSSGQVRHWLVYGVQISGGTVSLANGTQVTQYAGPAPPAGSGPHRYTIALYSQPSTFTPPANLSTANIGLATGFDFPAFVQSTGLGPLVAGTYFTVENGAASFSISPTSSVVSATLPAARSSSTSSTGPSPSSTHSGATSNFVTMGSLLGAVVLLSYVMV